MNEIIKRGPTLPESGFYIPNYSRKGAAKKPQYTALPGSQLMNLASEDIEEAEFSPVDDSFKVEDASQQTAADNQPVADEQSVYAPKRNRFRAVEPVVKEEKPKAKKEAIDYNALAIEALEKRIKELKDDQKKLKADIYKMWDVDYEKVKNTPFAERFFKDCKAEEARKKKMIDDIDHKIYKLQQDINRLQAKPRNGFSPAIVAFFLVSNIALFVSIIMILNSLYGSPKATEVSLKQNDLLVEIQELRREGYEVVSVAKLSKGQNFERDINYEVQFRLLVTKPFLYGDKVTTKVGENQLLELGNNPSVYHLQATALEDSEFIYLERIHDNNNLFDMIQTGLDWLFGFLESIFSTFLMVVLMVVILAVAAADIVLIFRLAKNGRV